MRSRKELVKLSNEVSQEEDRIRNSTPIKRIIQHFMPTLIADAENRKGTVSEEEE